MSTGDEESPEFDLQDAYGVETPDDNRALYAAWADTYDSNFIDANAYVYHAGVADVLCRHLVDGPVLDVGCGTGMVGVALRQRGVTIIDGIDISPEMLAKAARKLDGDTSIYRSLIEADLTQTIDLADNAYHGIISAGAFTHGHLGPAALDELFRVAAPGAHTAIGVNANHFEDHGFRAYLDRLVEAGTLTPYELVEIPVYDLSGPFGEPDNPDHRAQVVTCMVAS